VHEHKAGGLKLMSSIDQFPEWYFATRNIAARHGIDAEQLEMLINVKGQQPFMGLLAQRAYILPDRASATDVPRSKEVVLGEGLVRWRTVPTGWAFRSGKCVSGQAQLTSLSRYGAYDPARSISDANSSESTTKATFR
jgi:hypothetical protein